MCGLVSSKIYLYMLLFDLLLVGQLSVETFANTTPGVVLRYVKYPFYI